MYDDLDLTQAVSTRISHDLIGNIGAVSNAVELLEEGDMDFLPDIKSILNTSSSVLSARLKFFRMAFGLDNSNLENLAIIEQTCAAYLQTIGNRNTPIELSFRLKSPAFGRWAMLGVMIVADALVKGGKIEVEDDGQRLVIATVGAALSAEKVSQMSKIVQGQQPDNLAFYAPLLYLCHNVSLPGRSLRLLDSQGLALLVE